MDKTNLIDSIIDFNRKNNLFCILVNNIVIAIAFVRNDDVVVYRNIDVDDNLYIPINKNKIYVSNTDVATTISPVIETLIRNTDHKYKNIGAYLLNKICDHFKNTHKIIYLIPESTRYKHIGTNPCDITNTNKYKESNNKLIEYYKNQGFSIENKYYIDVCNNDTFLIYNVMSKILN